MNQNMVLKAYNPFFHAFSDQVMIYIVPAKEKAEEWVKKGIFPLDKTIVKTREEGPEVTGFAVRPGLLGKPLEDIMDEMLRSMEHHFGQTRIPFGALPIGIRFEAMSKASFRGAFIKTGRNLAKTDTTDPIEIEYELGEIVVTLPEGMEPW